MDTVTTNEAYENLANAIVVQAVKDYPHRTRECLNFFLRINTCVKKI